MLASVIFVLNRTALCLSALKITCRSVRSHRLRRPRCSRVFRYRACKCHFPISGLVAVLILILESWFCNLENASRILQHLYASPCILPAADHLHRPCLSRQSIIMVKFGTAALSRLKPELHVFTRGSLARLAGGESMTAATGVS